MTGPPPRMTTSIGVLALALAAPCPARADPPYTMKDLRMVAEGGGWLELAQHLGDIPPAKRRREWEALLHRAANGLVEQAARVDQPIDAVAATDALIRQFPALEKSKQLMGRRNEVGLAAFARCLPDPDAAEACLAELKPFLAEDPGNADLAMQAGKVVRRNLNAYAAVPFFARVMQLDRINRGRRLCADEDVKQAVLGGLTLPSTRAKEYVEQSLAIAGACWDELGPAILQGLAEGGGSVKENVCPLLASRGALGAEEQRLCAPAE